MKEKQKNTSKKRKNGIWFNDTTTIESFSQETASKLEKTIELLKTRVKMFEIYHEPKKRYYYLYIGGRIVFLSREEYELLRDVLVDE